jgi:hypothetical protein
MDTRGNDLVAPGVGRLGKGAADPAATAGNHSVAGNTHEDLTAKFETRSSPGRFPRVPTRKHHLWRQWFCVMGQARGQVAEYLVSQGSGGSSQPSCTNFVGVE